MTHWWVHTDGLEIHGLFTSLVVVILFIYLGLAEIGLNIDHMDTNWMKAGVLFCSIKMTIVDIIHTEID